MFSAVILTLNEEHNLPACLASLHGCDDIVVLDSGSTDRTHEIAQAAGARVVVNRFENFAQQRNHAHTAISFKHDWLFHLDADEQMTPELTKECSGLAQKTPALLDGRLVAPRMIFRGRWIPHCTDFPAYQARFVHVQRFRFIQSGHGQREDPAMRLEKMQANYLHNLSSQSESELKEKYRRYARQEAAAFLARTPAQESLRSRLLSGNPLIRRRALKEFSQHLPARGMLRFIYQYILKRGFLDGSAGFAYCRMLARYEADIGREIHRQGKSME